MIQSKISSDISRFSRFSLTFHLPCRCSYCVLLLYGKMPCENVMSSLKVEFYQVASLIQHFSDPAGVAPLHMFIFAFGSWKCVDSIDSRSGTGQRSSSCCWHESRSQHTLFFVSVVRFWEQLYLHNLGLIGTKQKPCVNYLWRCNDFRARKILHLVSDVGWREGCAFMSGYSLICFIPAWCADRLWENSWEAFCTKTCSDYISDKLKGLIIIIIFFFHIS